MSRDHAGEFEFVGESPPLVALKSKIRRVAPSDARVLITGESGVGKELVATAIHWGSPRRARAFLPVNCAGLAETLLESELFGHVKGSFTGAYRDKLGTLEIANEGTVFLDEIGEMSLRMQGMLLRFLETGELQKVGAARPGRRVNVRIITSTNRDLRAMIARQEFREDLFYRLNVVHLVVPPLRDRKEDIPALINHFLEQVVGKSRHLLRGIAPDALALLRAYSWPGNVRELENVIERLAVTSRSEVAGIDDLPSEIRTARAPAQPSREHTRTVVDNLYKRLVEDQESFWTAVYPLYIGREITRSDVQELVRRGLEEARGNYKIVLSLFNMEPRDYNKFISFLRKHQCKVPFKQYRRAEKVQSLLDEAS
jgi:two-component system response regulator HydG